MKRRLSTTTVLMAVLLSGACATSANAQQHQFLEASKPLAQGEAPRIVDGFQEIRWRELVPPEWRPKTRLLGRKVQSMRDDDPEALAYMRQLQTEWDEAPTNPALNGAPVRLAGYIVPLEDVKGEIKELLLVPYYGACIHVPPPPANQIVHIVLAKPAPGYKTMDPVWISGKMIATREQTDMAVTGYQMQSAKIEHYEAPANP